jgi:lipopolysaccharide/colanic/teichoic acid biosynthesis glycosyltransferase
MTPATRAFDLAALVILTVVLALPFAMIFALHLVIMGRPFLYKSERMRGPDDAFILWKLRSMHPATRDAGVSGGDKAARIPRWGRFLRASKMDEVPQLWNVLRGDIRLIGPRPPLRSYVVRFPALYAEVLAVPPGITGLATIAFHRHESRLLSNCRTAEDTDAVYARRCIPRKARMDLIYQRHRSPRLDLLVLLWTVAALARPRPHRLMRRRAGARRALNRPASWAFPTIAGRAT